MISSIYNELCQLNSSIYISRRIWENFESELISVALSIANSKTGTCLLRVLRSIDPACCFLHWQIANWQTHIWIERNVNFGKWTSACSNIHICNMLQHKVFAWIFYYWKIHDFFTLPFVLNIQQNDKCNYVHNMTAIKLERRFFLFVCLYCWCVYYVDIIGLSIHLL